MMGTKEHEESPQQSYIPTNPFGQTTTDGSNKVL